MGLGVLGRAICPILSFSGGGTLDREATTLTSDRPQDPSWSLELTVCKEVSELGDSRLSDILKPAISYTARQSPDTPFPPPRPRPPTPSHWLLGSCSHSRVRGGRTGGWPHGMGTWPGIPAISYSEAQAVEQISRGAAWWERG